MKIVRTSLAVLTRFLQEAGARRVPEGQRLEITVTNIDMAGDPPRIDLQFRLLGADGADGRAGTRRLRDSDHLTSAAPVTADHLRHEKALLLDWLQRELREATGS